MFFARNGEKSYKHLTAPSLDGTDQIYIFQKDPSRKIAPRILFYILFSYKRVFGADDAKTIFALCPYLFGDSFCCFIRRHFTIGR